MFIGREKELKTLHELYDLNSLEGAIVYGRRRMGKTSLIKESAKIFKGSFIYYQCLKAPDEVNARGLASIISSYFPDVVIPSKSSFCEVLSIAFSISMKSHILLVLDEYPYLEERETIDSFLQSKMEEWKEKSQIKIILSGSYVDVMEELLGSNHPLHGRIRYKIKIDAFDYYDSSKFYPKASLVDKVRFYSVFGGTPYYLKMINSSLSFEKNVKNLILDEFAPLESEIRTTLHEEYSKIENSAFVMNLIVSGRHSFSDINSAFKEACPKSDLNYLLNYLIDMKFVQKRYSINDKKEARAYYSLLDNLFSFYYLLVYPTLAQKSILSVDDYFRLFIERKMNEEYIPHKFEDICKEFLLKENKAGRITPPLLALGPYTYNDPKAHRNGQFDIVGQDENGNIFYDCKFTKEKISSNVEKEEIRQIETAKLPYYKLGFFSRSGYIDMESTQRRLCYSLEDLYR